MAAMWPSSWSTKNWVEKRTTTKTLSTESQRCLAGRRKRTPRGLWISKRERGRGHNNIHMYTHTGKGKELKRRGRRRRGEIKSLEASPDWTHKVVRCFKLVRGWGVGSSSLCYRQSPLFRNERQLCFSHSNTLKFVSNFVWKIGYKKMMKLTGKK